MKESYRFLHFLPNFSSFFSLFFPIFPLFSRFFPDFPDFWQIFRCQGWHSAPLAPILATPMIEKNVVGMLKRVEMHYGEIG